MKEEKRRYGMEFLNMPYKKVMSDIEEKIY